MKRILNAMMVMGVVAVCGCGHMAATTRTFTRQADDAPLVLKLTRHMDTVMNGPDIEEDQVLTLALLNYRLKVPVTIPSEAVKAEFSATRFGPTSRGDDFEGTVTVKSVTKTEVVATLKLSLMARTADGAYAQKWWFHGDYTFSPEKPRD